MEFVYSLPCASRMLKLALTAYARNLPVRERSGESTVVGKAAARALPADRAPSSSMNRLHGDSSMADLTGWFLLVPKLELWLVPKLELGNQHEAGVG